MASLLVRNIDDAFWKRVKSAAALEGVTLSALMLRLLHEWLAKKK